jgi:hypothetical protein
MTKYVAQGTFRGTYFPVNAALELFEFEIPYLLNRTVNNMFLIRAVLWNLDARAKKIWNP